MNVIVLCNLIVFMPYILDFHSMADVLCFADFVCNIFYIWIVVNHIDNNRVCTKI